VLFSLLAVVVLVKVFAYTLETGVKTRLEASLYGLMGVADIVDGALWVPQVLPEASFNQLTSGLYAWVQQADALPPDGVSASQSRRIWRSESSLGRSLPTVNHRPSGEFSWQSQHWGDQAVWVLSFSSAWSLGGEKTGYYQFSLAQAKTPILNQLAIFRRQLVLSFAVLAVLLCCIQGVLLRRGLRPLGVLAGQLNDIEEGKRQAVSGQFPLELRPMVTNLNATLETERQQRERYRHTLADLAHSLKTPLTIIKNSSQAKAEPGSELTPELTPEKRQMSTILEQVQRMDNIVQYQLKRSVAHGTAAATQRTDLLPILGKITAAMEKVYRDKPLNLQVIGTESAQEILVLMEEADLFELLGNILDNACKYCTTQVRVSLSRSTTELQVTVEDDGPGIPAEQRETVLARGKRLDEQGVTGQGIGMAVVADICRVYQVPLAIAQSTDLGGASLDLAFSYFRRSG
jgi:two-component system sensor histidine kinase PhoQ